jgi:hypothetical protein
MHLKGDHFYMIFFHHVYIEKKLCLNVNPGPMKSIYLNKIAVNYVKFYFLAFLYPILYLIVQKFDSILVIGLLLPEKKFWRD